MEAQKVSVAKQMIDSMKVTGVSEFVRFFETCRSNPEVMRATGNELMEMAESGKGWQRIKAVELLSMLKAKEAELPLSRILAREFPEAARNGLRDRPGDKGAQLLFVMLFTSLLIINPARWYQPATDAAAQLRGTWAEGGLSAILASIKEQDARRDGKEES